MTFSGQVYWIDTSNIDVIAKWDSSTGQISWLTVSNPDLPDLPVTGGTLTDNFGELGTLEPLGDGRIASSLGTAIAETVIVFDADLDPTSAEYWTDTPVVTGGSMYPDDFNAAYDPVRDALWMPRLRDRDSFTGSADTWTAYRTSDGAVLSSEARGDGNWDFTTELDSFTRAVYSRICVIGDHLYRSDSDGWVERYQIGGGSWDVTSALVTGGGWCVPVGARPDGTLVFAFSTPSGHLDLATFDAIDWVPISSPSSTLGAATPVGDLTPARTWSVAASFSGYAGQGEAASIKILDDVAYYFRPADDDAREFVAHHLATDTIDVVFTAPETYLLRDGTVTTGDDPDWWYRMSNAGWGIAVVPGGVTLTPPCQLYPRDDDQGAGGAAIWPPPSSGRPGSYY